LACEACSLFNAFTNKFREIETPLIEVQRAAMSFTTSVAFSLFVLGYKFTRSLRGANGDALQPASPNHASEPDLTGRVMMVPKIVETIEDDERSVLFAYFENSLAHSFWRAQELSLFRRASASFEQPVLDFGCGDGSFSACILKNIEYGVDIDEAALSVAKGYGIYQRLVGFEDLTTELPGSSVATVFSCSVLEHTGDLDACIHEIARVLKPGGRFHFSVPSPDFTEQMTELIDNTFAETVNGFMFHRNLLSEVEWKALLSEHDLQIDRFESFQAIEFTRQYFCLSLLGSRGVGKIPGLAVVRRLFWRSFRSSLLDKIAASVNHPVAKGANFFITGVKI
jgi:SAM-dependent methyltransferase